jgi:NTP pyrophosphatase (non-canonical NTP hydrolase)
MTTTPEFTESALKNKYAELSFTQLTCFTEALEEEIRHYASQGASDEQWVNAQVIKLGSEVGEFLGAVDRYNGFARRAGTKRDMLKELADVVISAFVMFAALDEDAEYHIKLKLWEVITRGYVNKGE